MEKIICGKKIKDGSLVRLVYNENNLADEIIIIGQIKFLEKTRFLRSNDAVVRYQYKERVSNLASFDYGYFIQTSKVIELDLLKKV